MFVLDTTQQGVCLRFLLASKNWLALLIFVFVHRTDAVFPCHPYQHDLPVSPLFALSPMLNTVLVLGAMTPERSC